MKNLDKLLRLEIITRKDLKEEGYSDYEIKKLVLDGVIEKTGRAMYRSIKEKNTFDELVTSFNNHDSDKVSKIYDELSDKDKYNSEIIKLLLVSLSRIENILNNEYKLQRNDNMSKEVIELEEIVEDVSNITEDIVEVKEPLEEKKEELGQDIKIEEKEFDVNLYLDNLYCEYKNAMVYKDYYRARDLLVEYNYYCKKYNLDDDCFHELFKLTNKINSLELDIEEKKSISFLIQEIKKNIVDGKNFIDLKYVKKLLDEFRELPSFNSNYYYHKYKAIYLINTSVFGLAINEYLKAVEINPYNKYDHYWLAWLYHTNMKSKIDEENALKYINNFAYYSRNVFSPGQRATLTNIYIFNHMKDRAIEVLDNTENYDEKYRVLFFERFSSMYMKSYNFLKNKQYSNIRIESAFANAFFKDNYLDIFTEYAIIHSDNYDDVFDNNEKNYQQELENAKGIVDSNSVTKFKELEEYLLNIDLTDEDNVNIMLDIVVYLIEKGFDKESSKYLKIVERIKDKPDSLKENYKETLAKIKIRKIANKNRS